jgi:3-dehydroquinate synthase
MSAASDLLIQSSSGSYGVTIAPGAFETLMAQRAGAFVIADARFTDHPALDPARTISVVAAETEKTMADGERVIIALREAGAQRGDHVVAVGGGIVQDVATLVAQLYMRGIPWSYVPTTLLGMVDSCIGGKSSINAGQFKNLVGSFHPPDEVIVDTAFLSTLPEEDLAGGLAEAMKITYCRGPEAFARYLELAAAFPGRAAELAHHALDSKRWFIEIDEFDKKERRLLNFGHTFGHALEAGTGYGVSHGIGVAIGVIAAERFAAATGVGAPDDALRAHATSLAVQAPELRQRLGRLDPATFERAFLGDKKHGADGLHVIVPSGAGAVGERVMPHSPATLAAVHGAMREAIATVGAA